MPRHAAPPAVPHPRPLRGHVQAGPDDVASRTPASRSARAPFLDARLWTTIQDSVPIACVDALLVRRDPAGRPTQVGLIRRTAPFGSGLTWCHVGGRVNLGETLAQALCRHLVDTLGPAAAFDLGDDPQPGHVMQYFRAPYTGSGLRAGYDPRKHAISLCYLLDVDETTAPRIAAVAGGEAREFAWINVDELPALTDTWPGTLTMARALLARS